MHNLLIIFELCLKQIYTLVFVFSVLWTKPKPLTKVLTLIVIQKYLLKFHKLYCETKLTYKIVSYITI